MQYRAGNRLKALLPITALGTFHALRLGFRIKVALDGSATGSAKFIIEGNDAITTLPSIVQYSTVLGPFTFYNLQRKSISDYPIP